MKSVVLFGHSDGGSIALLAAAREQERVRAVVTEGAHVFVEDVTLAGIREARDALATTDLRSRLARYHGDKVDGVVSAWTDTWLSPPFRDWNIESYLTRGHLSGARHSGRAGRVRDDGAGGVDRGRGGWPGAGTSDSGHWSHAASRCT